MSSYDASTHPFPIAQDLLPLLRPVESYEPDPDNARAHDEDDIDAKRGALKTHGQMRNFVGWRGLIIAGNGFFEAARSLGATHVAIVDVSNLEKPEAIRFALSDNRVGELSKWERQALTEQLDALREAGAEVNDLGWRPQEIEEFFLPAVPEPETETEKKQDAGEPEIPPGSDASRAKPIVLTPDQRGVFEEAVERVRLVCDDEAISEGRCLELICADYLSGA